MSAMFSMHPGLSTSNYDDILIKWAAEPLYLTGINFDAGSSYYSLASEMARVTLITCYQWVITDIGGEPFTPYPPYFVSTWNTSLGNADGTVTLPLDSLGIYNFIVDWGDLSSNQITAYNQPEIMHAYSVPGTYTINISGLIYGWSFWGIGDCEKLIDISQWGCLHLGDISLSAYFYGCTNLVCTATDALNLSAMGCSQTWDLSFMFYGDTLFNGSVGNWNTSNIQSMFQMFMGCSAFDRNVSSWNIQKVTDMTDMFDGVTLSTANYDALLIGWEAQPNPRGMNVVFDGGNSMYTPGTGGIARQSLIDNFLWTITDGGPIATDTDYPVSSVDVITPYLNNVPIDITVTASDVGSGLADAELWYRYSADNASWDNWTKHDTNVTPWEPIHFIFDFNNGSGYYEFYSRAHDNASNYENVTLFDVQTKLTFDGFEGSSWGNYTKIGTYATLSTTQAHTGTYSARLSSSTSNYFRHTNGIDVDTPGYYKITVDFWYRAAACSGSDKFYVAYYDGTTNNTVLTRAYTANSVWYHLTVDILESSYTFPNNMKIRFMSSTSANNHYIYIDDIYVNATCYSSYDTMARYDDEKPTSSANSIISPYWKKTSPLTITATASDTSSGVKNVTLYYSYSADNTSWGANTSFGIDSSSPYSFDFTFPSGTGHYRFYTIAKDNAGNIETATVYDTVCGYDNIAPTSNLNKTWSGYWFSAFGAQGAVANDTGSGLKNITLYYRYSSDNITWGSYILYTFGDNPVIWPDRNWIIKGINGSGYYQFYSIATDNATNIESVPGSPDAIYGFDFTTPTSTVDTITPYWHTSIPLDINVTASDTFSGLKNVYLYYRYSPDNISFGGWTLFGTDNDPWSIPIQFSFTFSNGTGYYQFYSIAKDNATNTEIAPGGADQICGYYLLVLSSNVEQYIPYLVTADNINLSISWAAGAIPGINGIDMHYRFSTDNSSWGAWTFCGGFPRSIPYAWNANPQNYNIGTGWLGNGYYEFYSIAVDNLSNFEAAPPSADCIIHYVAPPGIHLLYPTNGSEIDYPSYAGQPFNVSIIDNGSTFNWTIEIHELNYAMGYWNDSGYGDTSGTFTVAFGSQYNASFIAYVNVTNFGGITINEWFIWDFKPNCPPIAWTNPMNNSENNSLALMYQINWNDTTPTGPYTWNAYIFNNDTGVIFNNFWTGSGGAFPLTYNMSASFPLFGMNQSTWYDVIFTIMEWGDGCEECAGTGGGWYYGYDFTGIGLRTQTFRFKTVNFTGYTWWDNDWKAKKLVKFDVNETEASDLQVLINISMGPYGTPDDFTTFPPTIYINSSNLGECRFVAQYWNTSSSIWENTELYSYEELNSLTYTIVGLPYVGGNIPTWRHVWVRLPPSINGDKEYNWTAGELWIYFKNLNYFPYDPTAAPLTPNNDGNHTFDWFRGFNEYSKPSEWTTHTSGGDKWVTQPISGINTTGKRLRFYQTLSDWMSAHAGSSHYDDMFYLASDTNLNPVEKISYNLEASVDRGATDTKTICYITGRHSSVDYWYLFGAAHQHISALPLFTFYDLVWYNDTTIGLKGSDCNGEIVYDKNTTIPFDASLLDVIGFRLHTSASIRDQSWDWISPYLWYNNEDTWHGPGASDGLIKAYNTFLSIGKYIGREPTVTTTLLVELPYFILISPLNGATNVPLSPTISGMVINGAGGILQTDWLFYEPALGWYTWMQTNFSTSGILTLNTSLVPDAYRTMLDGRLWSNQYLTLCKWRITVTDGYSTYVKEYEFTTVYAIYANFTYVINGKQVTFTDTSTGQLTNMSNWLWDYGDGTIEDGIRNPVHYFYQNSDFTVTLTVEEMTNHYISTHTETLLMYVTPTVPPISIIWSFDWSIFVPYVYILIILMCFLVLIFTIFRSAGKRYRPPPGEK
jgi:surface protein